MRNIKIVFSYDGALFFGSQAQSNKKTVQDELELAILKLDMADIQMFTGKLPLEEFRREHTVQYDRLVATDYARPSQSSNRSVTASSVRG